MDTQFETQFTVFNLLVEDDYESYITAGFFTSREKAKEYLETIQKRWEDDGLGRDLFQWEIEEIAVKG